MKTFFASILLLVSFPVNAHENNLHYSNKKAYESQKGYALENKCFRYEYREYYVPGNYNSPGYVKSSKEKVSIPCNGHRNISNHYHYETEPQTKYVNYERTPKCAGSTTLGGLIGGGLAASISRRDAYGWAIPLGAVLGAGIGNNECK